jgi:hypothetical protein
MSTPPLDCELLFFRMKLPLPIVGGSKPTVCLLASDTLPPGDLSMLVRELVKVGCKYFMTWGRAGDGLHDALDEILESSDDDQLSIVTASHKEDSAKDVAWFLVHAALPGEARIRCCVGYDEGTEGFDDLLRAVRSETQNRCRSARADARAGSSPECLAPQGKDVE